MDIHAALDWRYAVREFSSEKLSNQTVESLVDATRKSASSYGLQPYKMIVVESQTVRKDLLPYSFGQQKVLDCSHLIVFAAHTGIGDQTVDRYVKQLMEVRGVPYDQVLGLTEQGLEASAIVALGHRSPNDKSAGLPKVRFDYDDVVIRM